MADSDAEKLVVGGEAATKGPLPAQAPQEVAVTITTEPTATEAKVQFKDYPVWITDSKGNQFQTQLRYKNGFLMWVVVGIVCLIGAAFLFPCVGVIPLCIKAFKDVEHINPNDGTVVGVYDRGTEVGLTRKKQ